MCALYLKCIQTASSWNYMKKLHQYWTVQSSFDHYSLHDTV